MPTTLEGQSQPQKASRQASSRGQLTHLGLLPLDSGTSTPGSEVLGN